jgi:hypothetical protein
LKNKRYFFFSFWLSTWTMYRNVAIQTIFLVKLWLLKLPKQHFNLALLIFNIANIIKHIFTFLGYILEKYGHFLKNLLIKISDFRWLENPQKTHTHTHTHTHTYFLATLKKNLANWLNVTKKNKTLPRTGSVFQLVFLPDWLTTLRAWTSCTKLVVAMWVQCLLYPSILWRSQVAIRAPGRFSQNWLKDKYESKIFLTTSFHISGYLLDQCIEIWRIFLKYFF